MKKGIRGKILYYMLHVTGFILLFFILKNFDWKSFGSLFRSFTIGDFMLGLSMLAIVYLLKSLRWLLINRSFGIRLGYGTTMIYFLVAGFLSVITPGRLGEFSRIYFLKNKTGITNTLATSSVVLDRVWDVLVLSMLGGIGALLIFGRFSVNVTTILIIAAFFLLALLVILFPSLAFIPIKRIFRKNKSLTADLTQVHKDWKNNASRLFLPGFSTTLVAFLALAVIPLIFTRRLNQDVGIIHSISAVSISNMLAFLPVTVGGFGTRELVFTEIWKILQYSKESAITISTAYFISNYFGSVVFGGATYMIWFRKHFSLKELKKRSSDSVSNELNKVIQNRNCTGCGACVLYSNGTASMINTKQGPVPSLKNAEFSAEALDVCPGRGIHYPDMYDQHYGAQPLNYLHGKIEKVRIGYAEKNAIRSKAASGGVITATLIYLLQKHHIDGVICVKQGSPTPLEASAFIAKTEEEIRQGMQSVYIPVSVLHMISELRHGEKYAAVCLPEQSAALRKLQAMKHPGAMQVSFVLGPYTGTALYPSAINTFLRSKRVPKKDPVSSLKWREGEWPGYLEIKTSGGRVIKSKKIYYNFLIPFFVTHTSLRSMDFVNEFADLSVGDAWSPKYEKAGKGYSVFVTRSEKMEHIINEMVQKKILSGELVPEEDSIAMHGHMVDFKKRGSYIRNRMRSFFGYQVPNYGYRPTGITTSRVFTELVISSIFLLAGTRVGRGMMTLVPEKVLGPVFDFIRLRWKNISKPVKRKGLNNYQIKRD